MPKQGSSAYVHRLFACGLRFAAPRYCSGKPFWKNLYSSHAVYRICRFDSSSRCRDFRARLHRNRVPVPLFTYTIGATLFQAGIGLWSLSMPLQGEHVHPKSLPFQQQRLVVQLRCRGAELARYHVESKEQNGASPIRSDRW